ncbi:methyltransferase domain-containing protein [Frankia sp. CNm7]|uniref:Methyltransferase domain-containing protein n=1 Tax=Frankia nepalensis TaxID=1836974 RepID=A0A937RP71_9ACTN|nr:class I SAM-dependent methyltransferase [Frankia nepalensis]MBL7499349.1 methyltransferase domain-containing protein [Frankia nepalensis]MBL7516299.1 methyltransferase domain-containing protein [Frankia nepalensis]MBL7519595.1 methyltransferase domain-containing protein [Frankia nepalensis]MBL7632470.1 methyltransferase domain-containing protein [Frankia nepalensis]
MGVHVRTNRERWNEISDDYQRFNAPRIRGQAFTGAIAWGLWELPESELNILGDVAGLDVLEMGCGGSQWSTALARRGANPVGIDLSERQLLHSRRLQRETGLTFPLVQGSAESVPFADRSFHIVFADHGAFSFADPRRAIPESARILRPGGLLAFSHISPLYEITVEPGGDRAGRRLVRDYFGLRMFTDADGLVSANLPYGEWIGLFRSCGLTVEDLIETRPKADPNLTGRQRSDNSWARRWPSECIWRLRKTSG